MYITKLTDGKGHGYSIYAVVPDGKKCEIRYYINSLIERDAKQVLTRFKFISEHGLPINERQFRKIQNSDEIFEIKTDNVRIFCFKSRAETAPFNQHDPLIKKSIILTHAKMKNEVVKKKKLSREVDSAEKWRSKYFTGKVEIIEV
jgi:hypothetical protein